MGYIIRQRISPGVEKGYTAQNVTPYTRTEIERHYYCDQCGSWDVISVKTPPGIELALGCAKYLVLGLLLSGLAFWPALIMAIVLLVGVIVYEKRMKTRDTDIHHCNQCGFVWDQKAMSDSNPRGYSYNDYVTYEYVGVRSQK